MQTVLVIEDEAPLRANLVRILSAEDFRIVAASDGNEGIRRVRENRPDLVICDILMPQVDGFGVLAALRSRPESAAVPFIFLSASADRDDFARGLNSGANEYVIKPFKIADLLAIVRWLLPPAGN